MGYNKLFHGYNCYSAAVGEYCLRRKVSGVQELILSQWSFFFNLQMFLNGQWYTGAADGPVDLLLQKDLKRFCSLCIEEHCLPADAAETESLAILERDEQQIILVDFYYLKSVRWEHLRRFGIERQHDPHFIILEGRDREKFTFLDPYYDYRGQMERDVLQEARSSITRQGGVGYRHYIVNHVEQKKIDLREVLYYRFRRYIDEKQYNGIARLGEEILFSGDFILAQKNCRWALDGCFCLKSTVDQHRNLQQIAALHGILLPSELPELENEWALVRKLFFSIFVLRRACPADLLEVSEKLRRLAEREETFARRVIDTL